MRFNDLFYYATKDYFFFFFFVEEKSNWTTLKLDDSDATHSYSRYD